MTITNRPVVLLGLAILSFDLVAAEAFMPYTSQIFQRGVSVPNRKDERCFDTAIGRDSSSIALAVAEEDESGTPSNPAFPVGGAQKLMNKTPVWKKPIFKEMIAEMAGTFLIVMLGTGSVMSAIYTDSLSGLFQIASVWIIAVTLGICCTASISGAHLNPAVSLAFALVRPTSFPWKKVLPYSFSQLCGACLGSLVSFSMYASTAAAFEAANGISRSAASGIASAKAFGEYFASPVSTATALLAEAVGTGILGFIIFALTNEKNDTMKEGFVPPIIGLSVGALIAVIAPLTQAGFNPARDFGPRIVAFFSGWTAVAFQKWWVYVVGPLVGAPIGAFLADKVLYSD